MNLYVLCIMLSNLLDVGQKQIEIFGRERCNKITDLYSAVIVLKTPRRRPMSSAI